MNGKKAGTSRFIKYLGTSLIVLVALFLILSQIKATTVSAMMGEVVSAVKQRAAIVLQAKSSVEGRNSKSISGVSAKTSAKVSNVNLNTVAARDLKIVSASVANTATQVTVVIDYEAAGDENGLGFSIHFDPTYLALASAPALDTTANGVPAGTSLFTNPFTIPPSPGSGDVGFLVGLPFNVALSAGNHHLINLTFNILPAAKCGVVTPITFTSSPSAISASDTMGNPLTNPNTVSGSVTVTATPITFVTASPLPAGVAGQAYSGVNIVASGGSGTFTSYVVSGGALPGGLMLASNGALTGTPSATGPFSFTVKATDSNGCTGTKDFSITIGCPTITLSPASLPSGTIGVAYSSGVSASPAGTYVYGVSVGSLPNGLNLDVNTGAITGIPTGSGQSNFTITATGAGNCTGSKAYSISISCPTITLSPASPLPAGTQFTPYPQQNISSMGGNGTVNYTVTGGALPAGLMLASNGALTGTPTVNGTFNFTVTASDQNQCTGTKDYALTINCPTITLSPSSLPNGTAGTAYNQTVTVSPAGTYTFAVTGGSLPAGLLLNTNTGVISGTPTTAGTSNFTITATGFGTCTGSKAYSITVDCPTITLSPASLPNGTAGTAYNQSVSASPAGTTYSFAVSSGALPAGLMLNTSTGAITGTPTTNGTFNFTIKATGFGTCFGTNAYSIVIDCPTISLSPASLPNGTTGIAYNQSVSASPAGTTYSYALDGGSLPTGLMLNTSTGAITGTPTVANTFNFTITATGFGTCAGRKEYSITIVCPTITVNPATLPAANLNLPYNETLSGSGGTGPYTFMVTAGALPTGLMLSSSGSLTGTPTVATDFTFTVTATDKNNCTGSRSYTLSVLPCTPITVNPPTIPNGLVGVPYSQTFTQSGAIGGATFSLVGAAPPGLTFTNGVLSGTPTQGGTFNFTVKVVDGRGCIGTRDITLTVEKVTFINSDQAAGSILVYNYYTSSVTEKNKVNTRINLTNTNPNRGIVVHLFFVDGSNCSVADQYLCLTPSQTTTFLTSDIDPGTTGYIVAIAVNPQGCPVNFNFLIGDEYVKTATGHAANLAAESIGALIDNPSDCGANSTTANILFNGLNYSFLPRVLSLDNIASKLDGNDTLLIVNRIGGNLGTGASSPGTFFGLLFDDVEASYSFSLPGSSCQLAGILSNSFPRSTPRLDTVIPAGRTGWMKLWTNSDFAILGSSINFNANSAVNTGAFNQGHNLHKLTLTNTATLTIPVFSPACQQ